MLYDFERKYSREIRTLAGLLRHRDIRLLALTTASESEAVSAIEAFFKQHSELREFESLTELCILVRHLWDTTTEGSGLCAEEINQRINLAFSIGAGFSILNEKQNEGTEAKSVRLAAESVEAASVTCKTHSLSTLPFFEYDIQTCSQDGTLFTVCNHNQFRPAGTNADWAQFFENHELSAGADVRLVAPCPDALQLYSPRTTIYKNNSPDCGFFNLLASPILKLQKQGIYIGIDWATDGRKLTLRPWDINNPDRFPRKCETKENIAPGEFWNRLITQGEIKIDACDTELIYEQVYIATLVLCRIAREGFYFDKSTVLQKEDTKAPSCAFTVKLHPAITISKELFKTGKKTIERFYATLLKEETIIDTKTMQWMCTEINKMFNTKKGISLSEKKAQENKVRIFLRNHSIFSFDEIFPDIIRICSFLESIHGYVHILWLPRLEKLVLPANRQQWPMQNTKTEPEENEIDEDEVNKSQDKFPLFPEILQKYESVITGMLIATPDSFDSYWGINAAERYLNAEDKRTADAIERYLKN